MDLPQRIPLAGVEIGSVPFRRSRFSRQGQIEENAPAVSFYPCSNCGQRPNGKLATVYANWFEGDDKRKAYKQRLCVTCLTALMGLLQAGRSQESSELTVCPMCGKDSSEALDGNYLTVYPPKQESREYALTTCESCAGHLRELLQVGAVELGDRSVGAAAPTASPKSEWSDVPW